jgi:hypothetical protein
VAEQGSTWIKPDSRADVSNQSIRLKTGEINAAFAAAEMRQLFGPILDTPGVMRLLNVKRRTLYLWIAQGRLDGTFRKRGKHHLFWRDRVIDRVFNGINWEIKNGN